MDISPARRNLLALGLAVWIVNLSGCTQVVVARVWIATPGRMHESSETIKQILVDSGWKISEQFERDKIKHGLTTSAKGFVSIQPTLLGYTVSMEATDSGKTELTLGVGGTPEFSQDAVTTFRILVKQFQVHFGDAVTFDRQTSRGQSLFAATPIN